MSFANNKLPRSPPPTMLKSIKNQSSSGNLIKTTTLSSAHIPQADSLKRVVEFIKQLASGDLDSPEELGITPRQKSYYLKAAKILFLVDDDKNILEAGLATLALPEAARWARISLAFENSRCGQMWCEFAKADDLRGVDPASALDFLSSVSDLSASSQKRRSQTLKAWLKLLGKHHPSGPPTFTPYESIQAIPQAIQESLFTGQTTFSEDVSEAEIEPEPPLPKEARQARSDIGEEKSDNPETSSAETEINRRLRTLLRLAPILRLEATKGQRSIPLENYDLRSIALRIFEDVIAHMGMGGGTTRRELRHDLRPIVYQMDPQAPPERVHAVINMVLDGLLNARERRQAFSEAWISMEEAGPTKRTLSFHLLREEEMPSGEIVLRATNEGINIYAGMLDYDVEDAQAAVEAVLASQLKRGHIRKAISTAKLALQRSVEYEEKLKLLLDTTRRDVSQVDWVEDSIGLLKEARLHVKERISVEGGLVKDVEESLDFYAGEPKALLFVELRDILKKCFQRHLFLQGRIQTANQIWLEEQERQRYRPRMMTPIPDPEADVLLPALQLPTANLAVHCDELLRWHNPPRLPKVFFLPHLVDRLLKPRRQVSEALPPPSEIELHALDIEKAYFSVESYQHAWALIDDVLPCPLSVILQKSRENGQPQRVLQLLVLLALRSFDGKEEQSLLRAKRMGQPLDDPTFVGDDLYLYFEEPES